MNENASFNRGKYTLLAVIQTHVKKDANALLSKRHIMEINITLNYTCCTYVSREAGEYSWCMFYGVLTLA